MEKLPTQEEITKNWISNKENPVVSILCSTYNHSEYIKDALNGFVSQITTFPFEIIIHDDASTDETAAIIKSYSQLYPDLITPIIQVENQYSKGISGLQFMYQRARGKYIALCEGDDYWINPRKLQIQKTLLDKEQDIDICTHRYKILNSKKFRSSHSSHDFPSTEKKFDISEALSNKLRLTKTNTMMIRRSVIESFLNFRKKNIATPIGDKFIAFFGSLKQGGICINMEMSVYRELSQGSWSTEILASLDKALKSSQNKIDCLINLDDFTHRKYRKLIENQIFNTVRWTVNQTSIPIKIRLKFILSKKNALSTKNIFHLLTLLALKIK